MGSWGHTRGERILELAISNKLERIHGLIDQYQELLNDWYADNEIFDEKEALRDRVDHLMIVINGLSMATSTENRSKEKN